MLPSLRDLWDRITSRPSRKHLKRQLEGQQQRTARLSERVAALEATKAALTELVAVERERAAVEATKRRDLIAAIIEKDLVEAVES